jgi:transposase
VIRWLGWASWSSQAAKNGTVPKHPLPPVDAEESAALERDYRYGESRLVRQRSQIVLLVYTLPNQAQVAQAVRCSLDTIQRTLALYRAGGRSALRPRPQSKPEPVRKRTLSWQKALAEAMAAGPAAGGLARPTWTAPLLAEHLSQQTGVAVGERTVRRGLESLGYVCRRPTWTVRHKAEEQPDYAPKGKGSKRS